MKILTEAQIKFLNDIVDYGIGVDNSEEALRARLYKARPAMLQEQKEIEEIERKNYMLAHSRELIRTKRKLR